MDTARGAVAIAIMALVLAAPLVVPFADGAGDRAADEQRGGDGASSTPEGDRSDGDGRRVDVGDALGEGSRAPAPNGSSDRRGGIARGLANLLEAILGSGEGNATALPSNRTLVTVLEEPVPGRRVTVLVTRGGQPVAGVPVAFNGRAIGATDRTGRVTGRVPYDDRLVVTAGDVQVTPTRETETGGNADSDTDTTATDTARSRETGRPAAPVPVAIASGPTTAPWRWLTLADRHVDAADPVLVTEPPRSRRQQGEAGPVDDTDGDNATATETAEREYRLPTDANLTVEGAIAPGATVTLVATVGGYPLRGATVAVNGETVGRTDADGRLTYTVGRVRYASVVIDRGVVHGERRLAVQPINLSLAGLAVPGQPVTVRASLRGEPVDVPVRFNGRTVGQTGADGRLRATVPVANRLVATARTDDDVVVRRVVDWMLLPVVGLGTLLVGTVAGRRRVDGRRVIGRIRGRARAGVARLVDALTAGLVGVAGGLDRVRTALGAALARGRRAIAGLVATGRAALTRPRAVGAWLREVPGRLLDGLRAAIARLWGLWTVGKAAGAGDGAAENDRNGAGIDPVGADPGAETSQSAHERLRHVWDALVATSGVAPRHTHTPGEVRAAALSAGLPREPVETLTDAFRAVEYGRADPRDVVDGAERAASAMDLDRASTRSTARDTAPAASATDGSPGRETPRDRTDGGDE